MRPLVSVNITTYNRAHLLQRCLDSVLSQSYKNIQVVIVDDASTDSTEEIVNTYVTRFLRLNYVKHTCNLGNAAARNRGLQECEGSVIAFLDDDDEWIDVNKVMKQVDLLSQSPDPNRVIICSGVVRQMTNTMATNEPCHRPRSLHRAVLKGGLIHNSTALMSRSLIELVGGFDLKIDSGVDSDFFRRAIILHSARVVFMPELTCRYYEDSADRMTTRNDIGALKRKRYSNMRVLWKFAPYYLIYPAALLTRITKILRAQRDINKHGK